MEADLIDYLSDMADDFLEVYLCVVATSID